MARTQNDLQTVAFKISTNPQIVDELKILVRTGHYGKNHAEAAERIIARELDRVFGEESLQMARDSQRQNARRSGIPS